MFISLLKCLTEQTQDWDFYIVKAVNLEVLNVQPSLLMVTTIQGALMCNEYITAICCLHPAGDQK